MTRNKLIVLLQGYKILKSCEVGKYIHLYWNNGIDWSESVGGGTQTFFDPIIQIRKELIRDLIQWDTENEIDHRYAAGVICRDLEKKLGKLTDRGSRILFDYYINHDFEWKYNKYQGLSEREIARRLHTSQFRVQKVIENSLNRMLKMYSNVEEQG